MSDPLSVAGSIAGLLSIADVVFRRLYHYVKTVKKAEKEILGFKNEVAALTGVLHNLHLIAEELEDDSTFDNAIRTDHVTACSATLMRLDSLLSKIQFSKDQNVKNTLQKLKWPFKLTETNELGDEVRRHRETLSLALSADTMVALLQCLSSQKDIINQLNGIQATLQKNKDIQLGIALSEDRKRIWKSFFKVEPSLYYEKSLKDRHSGTGSWLYQDSAFQSWLDEPGSRVWLTGIPGAGKTVLSGMIIQECFARASATEAIAYYYCDYSNPFSQSIVNILSALAGQIATRNEDSFKLLKDYYDQLHARDQMARQPKIEELITLIHDMASLFDNVRVIVDGLDECGEAMTAATESLHKLVCAPRATISLAILSRKEQLIGNVLEGDDNYNYIEIAAHEEDIKRYVESEIEARMQKKLLRIRSAELKILIVQELISKADGMFRWVACQLDHLCGLATDLQRRKALTQLPRTLEESYERILLRVKKPVAPLVSRTLQWLAYGTPKLEIDALLEALSIEDDSDVLDPEARTTEEELLLHCSSLIRKTGTHLEFAHFTVQEYLQNLTTDNGQLSQFCLARDSKTVLAKACLSYLCLPVFDTPPEPFLEDFGSFKEDYPFHTHASIAWSGYMEGAWSDTGLRHLYRRLFNLKKTPNFVLYTIQRLVGNGINKGQEITVPTVENDCFGIVCDEEFRPLHAASLFGLKEVCQWLVDQGCDVNLPSPMGTPLTLCFGTMFNFYKLVGLKISVDDLAIAETFAFLRKSGAAEDTIPESILQVLTEFSDGDFNVIEAVKSFQERAEVQLSPAHSAISDDTFDARLFHCIARDQVERVSYFSRDPRFSSRSPEYNVDLLHWAADQGAVRTMALLLDLGFDPAAQDEHGKNVLHHCIHLENDAVLSQFVASPGIENPASDGSTIWHHAAAAGALRMLELLVEHSEAALGLLKTYEGRTPLMYAIASGSEPCCLFLVRTMQAHGQALDDPAILHSCIAMGLSRVLLQILDYGYSIQAITDNRRSAWFFVTPSTTSDMFEMMLSMGVDPLSQDAMGKSPLHALFDGTRRADPQNSQKGAKNGVNSLVDRKTLTLRLDEVNEMMLDHLLTSTSAQLKDDEGHTPWFYFCTKYVPRFLRTIENQNTLANDSLETLVRRLALGHAIEAFESENETLTGVELLIEECLDIFEDASDRCKGVIARVLNVLVTYEGIVIDGEKDIMTRLIVWSIENREKKIFDLLLNCGVDIHCGNSRSNGDSALGTSAFGYGDFDMFIELINHAKLDRLNDLDGQGWAPIHAVCDANDESSARLKRLQALLEAGASPDVRTKTSNMTALHLAAGSDFIEGFQTLLEYKADITLRDADGWDVMAYAVYHGSSEIFQFLENQFGDDKTVHNCEHRYALKESVAPTLGCTLFHLATVRDEVEMLEKLKLGGRFTNMHEASEIGKTPLYLAAGFNAEKCARWLIKHGADLNARTYEAQSTALHRAVTNGNFSIVTILVRAGAELLKDKRNKRPDYYVPKGKEKKLFKALERSHAPDLVSLNLLSGAAAGFQPFFKAIRDEDVDACHTMIRKDPHIVSTPSLDCGVCTPLILSLRKACIEVVRLLLESGATTAGYRCNNHYSKTSDHCGASSIQLAIMRPELNSALPLLLDLWSLQHTDSWHGVTPVSVAAAFNPEAIDIIHDHVISHAERYLDFNFHKPADFRSRQFDRVPSWGLWDAPPLHVAVHNKKLKSVLRLLAYGADVRSRDVQGATALHIAAMHGYIDIAEILFAHGADANARDEWLRTPLIICAGATHNDDWDFAKLLLSQGADKHAKDFNGETALHAAALEGRLNMFLLLLDAGCDPTTKTRPGGHCALASALKHPHMATYIYARGFNLDHLIPRDADNFSLVHWTENYLKRLLRYLPKKTRVKMINYETRSTTNALVEAASVEDINALDDLMKAGADIEFAACNGWGSALIAACTVDRLESVKRLVYYGAKYESTIDGTRITATQAARHSPRLVQWLLVGRYTEQPRLTNFAAQTGQSVKSWSGVRQLEIGLDGFYKRSHRRACHSLFEYVCWIYGQRDSWRQMVPLSWKPEAHFAALPGEPGHPLEARFALRVKDDGSMEL